MTPYLLDTDVVSNYQRGHSEVVRRVNAFKEGELGLAVTTVIERLSGFYAAIHDKKRWKTRENLAQLYIGLADSAQLFGLFKIAPFPVGAMNRFDAMLRQMPPHGVKGYSMKEKDLRIGCIALEYGSTVITHNGIDFKRIPGLKEGENLIIWPGPSKR